jgi:hypothetical protein
VDLRLGEQLKLAFRQQVVFPLSSHLNLHERLEVMSGEGWQKYPSVVFLRAI